MADERIDVEVTDKVSSSVETKLRGIGDAAGDAHKYVEQLKAALASMNVAGALKAEAAANSTTRALAQQMNAQARLTDATSKGALADAKAAVEKQKLATETARTEAATARAAAAQSQAALAALRASAAADRAANSTSSYAARAERLKSSLDPAYAAQSKFNAEVAEAKTLLENGAIGMNTYSDAVAQANNRLKASAQGFSAVSRGAGTYSANMNNVAGATGLAGHQMGNLVAQLNDVGVSLAGGQNPLLVLIQQGSQIQYLASTVEGGFGTLIKATTALVIGQQQVTNATTAQATATAASAQAAATAAAAQAAQAGIAANVVIAEQALTVAQTEAGGAAARLAVANAALSSAQAAVTATAVPSTEALTALALAEARATAAAQANVIANAELAAAQSGVAASAAAAANAQRQLALSSAGTALGLGTVGAILVGIGAVAGPATAKLVGFHKELNENSGIKEYVNTLGLTTKELKKLEDQTITYGDMASGVWMTIKEGVAGLQPVFDAIGAFIMGTVDLIWNTLKNFSFGMTALFKGTYTAVITIWNQFPAAFADLFAQAANAAIGALEWIANKAVDVLNYLGGSFETVTLSRWENANAGAAARMGSDLVSGYTDAFREAESGYNAFVNRVGQNADKAARDRLKKSAQAIIEDRGAGPKAKKGREDKTEENRAMALANVNRELDNEISRMKLLKDERAIQQRYDQIEEQLARKKITLTADESKALKDKIAAIEADKYVQSERDRIMEEATGPQRDYNSAIAAATDLLARHAITQEQFNQQQTKATIALAEATDPLYAMKKANAETTATLGLYGDALARANDLQAIKAAYAEKNLSIYDAETGKLKEAVAAQLAENEALRQKQYIQSQVAAVVDPLLADQQMLANKANVYAELNRMADEYNLNETQRAEARVALDRKYQELQLKNYTGFFDTLAGLSSSSNSTLAAIGKAAAISQATINMYVAASEALKLPFPANLPAIAQVIATGAGLISSITSTNAGNFATGGAFMVEGRSGVDMNNVNMNLTRGERVTIETPAQQRANDSASNGSPASMGDVKIVNQFDEREFISAMDSDEGERIILNVIKRNPNAIKSAGS
ncbi:hypothetical protein P9A28_gp15 [Sphingomonas phage Eidolon]|uniref:Bacteriophage tail tape measure N-terminal domain-containing protein n=1 Tax=Sphingomonas phage Eidolon TaxID=2686311 RepID=A0A6M3T9S4_9CAUD|nr:hypothetical protein P9A28_gp15 [Sphingomonas phage Eidolon]QJD54401.1 hypothetical protein [Sphingomonas phage Eidolon]